MPEKERLYGAHYHAKMVEPVTLPDLRGCEYFTIKPSGARFQLRSTELREMVNTIDRGIQVGSHVGTVISFDKTGFKIKMYRLGLSWEARVLYTDITMFNYAEKYY